MEPLKNENYNILIIEDDAKSAQMLGLLLGNEGYSVLVASGGEDALVSGQVLKADLILLDIKLPGINGIEVCQKLKSNDKTRYTPIIFLTSESDQLTKIEGFRVGGADYVCKPFDDLELLARINTHLALKAYRDQLVKDAEIRIKLKAHGIISHEVFNPLTAIIGYLELIEVDLKKDNFNAEKLLDHIKKAKGSGSEIIEKVNQLKAFKDITGLDFQGLASLIDTDE
ncbi:response regulator [Bacteriovoracales bacterium]|nr:response regulator [Bacteriovoracales bacterium]